MNTEDTLMPEVLDGRDYSVAEIPSVVRSCIVGLSGLQRKVDQAVERSDSARGLAKRAANVELHWWKVGDKASAIEALQWAVRGQSEAMVDQSEAMKAMFEYQGAISRAIRFLVGLGVSSLAANRSVYQSLKLELEGASRDELSELAKKELKNAVEQLKAQQDILAQQEKTRESVRENRMLITTNKEAISKNKESIEKINELDAEQERELARQRGKDNEHDHRLDALESHVRSLRHASAQQEKTRENVRENRMFIATNREAISKNKESIEKINKLDAEQERELARQRRKDDEHDHRLDTLESHVSSLRDASVQQEKTRENVRENRMFIATNKESIEKINKLDAEQERELARQRGKDDEHDQRLSELESRVSSLEKQLGDGSVRTRGKGGNLLLWLCVMAIVVIEIIRYLK